MLKILIRAFLQQYVGWARAREIARLTNELRILSNAGHHGDRAHRVHGRLTKLYAEAE